MTNFVSPDFWEGKRVFVTGHTGFKGAWLSSWLLSMGAEVHGYALTPVYHRSPYELAELSARITETLADINDARSVSDALNAANPHIVFHLAAQPLVRSSYREPVQTYATNVMGTVNLLAALQHCRSLQAVVVVTTDKCYLNQELERGYNEDDRLGGSDPYSSSKACVELLVKSWYQSFMREGNVRNHSAGLATVRAGNVIGGGDWSEDRLIPDVLRALERGDEPVIRNPAAVRPWQYVLDPLAGYLTLAQRLAADPSGYSEPWNFGPDRSDARSVGEVVERLLKLLSPESTWTYVADSVMAETSRLYLDCSKVHSRLGWRPQFGLDSALDRVAAWHARESDGADMSAFMDSEVTNYTQEAKQQTHGS
ncbi:CDP-glucose 4,6-dehydratase [Congregibacter litoralis]|uniref:CDP-glucose 4,6-dehydratase n=1 Tax=Congregibacter litoralis TaxID=393662 RepID=UPI0005903A5B|nr:CDP-glucose 4,6-dehydratase [Congregibacter litoralis]